MDQVSLTSLVKEHLDKALAANSGRSAVTVYGGSKHQLRQTLIAISAGNRLAEHESPGEATLQVLRGSIVLSTARNKWELNEGDLCAIPAELHAVDATSDSVFLLTVVKN